MIGLHSDLPFTEGVMKGTNLAAVLNFFQESKNGLDTISTEGP